MILAILIVLVVVPLLTALGLTRKWAQEEVGVDLDAEKMGAKQAKKLHPDHKFVLALLLMPTGVFFLALVLYVISSFVTLT